MYAYTFQDGTKYTIVMYKEKDNRSSKKRNRGKHLNISYAHNTTRDRAKLCEFSYINTNLE